MFGLKYSPSSLEIGYEVELNGAPHIDKKIAKDNGLSFTDYRISPNLLNLNLKLSEEYYPETTEINVYKSKNSKLLHRKIQKLIKDICKKYSLELYGPDPRFVGTHIHLFKTNILSEPDVIDRTLRIVMSFIIENESYIHKESMYRLIKAHQLWGFLATHEYPELRHILETKLGKEFNYLQSASSKPKYAGVIKSPRSRLGKIQTLEIRLVPTEFVTNNLIGQLVDNIVAYQPVTKTVYELYSDMVDIYKSKKDKPKVKKESISTGVSELLERITGNNNIPQGNYITSGLVSAVNENRLQRVQAPAMRGNTIRNTVAIDISDGESPEESLFESAMRQHLEATLDSTFNS